MPNILVDTGVWIALCDPRDLTVSKNEIEKIYEKVSAHTIVLLWPVAYETLRTRFVKNKIALERFEKELKSPRIVKVDDARFREAAFSLSIDSSLRKNRPLSMVDCLMRILMDDQNTKIDFLATFNQKDFVDICRKRQIEIVSA